LVVAQGLDTAYHPILAFCERAVTLQRDVAAAGQVIQDDLIYFGVRRLILRPIRDR
jgi:hypothetical protein